VSAVFLLAGGVKGITGMGLPTVAVSLLTLWMTPTQAAGLIVVPTLLTNVAQCRGPNARRLFGLLWPTWLALVVVTVLVPDPRLWAGWLSAHTVLGVVLLAYGIWGLLRPEVPGPSERAALLATIIGAATGFTAALTAVFVFPLVPYLQAMHLEKDTLVQALGLSFTIATVALAVRLQLLETSSAISPESLLGLPGALVGLWLGTAVRVHISAALFQRTLFVVFIGLGLANVLRGS
jgi:uncharacterized membrane protein YfcA